MIARVVTFQGPPEGIAERGAQGFNERILPTLRRQAGFQSALVLLDRAQGKLLGITLWDTEEHARAAAAALEPLRETSSAEMGATAATAETYEVVARG